jgi:hypothetical protein
MRRTRHVVSRYLVALAATAALLGAGALTAAAAAGPALAATSGQVGYLRLAHLSPNTPPVDVYLYSFDHAKALVVLKHVAYGTVSPYQTVRSGEYTVAMRAAGAAPSSRPVLSTSVSIAPGNAYTVAGMGPRLGLRLQVMRDRLSAPRGHALVRVIQASLRQHLVSVSADGHAVTRSQAFASISSYRDMRAGPSTVRAVGPSEDASTTVDLHSDGIYTLVVLDDPGHLVITSLEDAAGSAVAPAGPAATGFGGLAPKPRPAQLPWFIAVAAGLILILGGASWLRQGPIRGH